MNRSRSVVGVMLSVGLLFDCHWARASAIALSQITASNLQLSSSSGSIVFDDPFTTFAFAQAQNSLGELDAQFDAEADAPSRADAAVTWADGHARIGDAERSASSAVNLPGTSTSAASSVGQGTWSDTFTIVGGVGPVDVSFAAALSGLLSLFTDSAGQLAQTETILNLLLDGDTVLFQDRLRSIGPNSTLLEPFADTLFASRTLQFDTSYSLILRVDSESTAINEVPVPEPPTAILFGLGLGLAVWCGKTRMRARVPPASVVS